ncbi:MAG: hypothetical protein R3F53_05930 [Gammaproteobacteria bacterium]
MYSKKRPILKMVKAKWAIITILLPATILVFDFITKAIGVADIIKNICCAPKPVLPVVAVRKTDTDWGGQCLEFAFSNLPENFALGRINLDINSSNGPIPIGGFQAAEILTRKINQELPATIFTSPKLINFDVRAQADNDSDVLYVDYCPTLDRPGLKGSLTVTPEFLSPSGEKIKNLEIILPDLQSKGVTFILSRPRNLAPHIVPSQLRSLP